MKRILLTFMLCALMSASTMAALILGSWEEGTTHSTHILFDFTLGKALTDRCR